MSEYKNDLIMTNFIHLKEISRYNFNYYIGFNGDLLFGKSDDDTTTQWWLLLGNNSKYLGESNCRDGDKLNLFEKEQR